MTFGLFLARGEKKIPPISRQTSSLDFWKEELLVSHTSRAGFHPCWGDAHVVGTTSPKHEAPKLCGTATSDHLGRGDGTHKPLAPLIGKFGTGTNPGTPVSVKRFSCSTESFHTVLKSTQVSLQSVLLYKA